MEDSKLNPAVTASEVPTDTFATKPDRRRSRKRAEKPRLTFRQSAAIVCMSAILGGATLGAGLGAGWSIGRYFFEAGQGAAVKPAFAFSDDNAEIIPVNVAVKDYAEVVKTVSDSVVSINVSATYTGMFGNGTEQEGAGSGIIFAIDETRVYIATNNHVIENTATYNISSVSISLNDEESVPASFVGSDSNSDLAVIAVQKADLDALGIAYRAAVFGNSDALRVGDEVIAMGNAMGEGQTATQGIVSAVNKQITIDDKTLDVLQTDAAINPGNSGGPLVNLRGEVIGINTAKVSAYDTEGMGYSIPSNIAIGILESLRENGSVKRPFLGISPIEIDDSLKELYSLPDKGVMVRSVTAGSAAEQAGLRMSDIIVGFNDMKITSIADLQDALAQISVGDEVLMKIYRNNTMITVPVVIGDANQVNNF